MHRAAALILLLFICFTARSVDNLSLDVKGLIAEGWSLHGLSIALGGLHEPSLNLNLKIRQLTLPQPFQQVSLVNIDCPLFIYEADLIACKKGYARLASTWLQADKTPFNFRIAAGKKNLALHNIQLAGGSADLSIEQSAQQWQFTVNAEKLRAGQLKSLLQLHDIDVSSGLISLRAHGRGQHETLQTLDLDFDLYNIGLQTTDFKYASEALYGKVNIKAIVAQGNWQWQATIIITQGAYYIDPVNVQVDTMPIEIHLSGVWEQHKNRWTIHDASYHHPGAGSLQSDGSLYDSLAGVMENAVVSIHSDHLDIFSRIYLQPFFAASALQGITLKGSAEVNAIFVQQALTKLRVLFSELDVNDEQSRFALLGGQGDINWTRQAANKSQTELVWLQLGVYGLEFGSGALSMTSDGGNFILNGATTLPLFDGTFTIQQFAWQSRAEQEPDVRFQGKIEQVSLQKLSSAMDWTPLSGTISGDIPGVTYQQGEVNLDGELNIRVFDGVVRLTKLSASGLFGYLPHLEAEVTIDNLDLNGITEKFSFGHIEGRLSGYINDLLLENWQPVTFYAWLGTPDGDKSRHRISQQAVENIASIGGGGAANAVSRSFLRFFDNFSYKRLGIGCYLYNGVCQLMGVKATEQGYYIVEGGGLPRIDVIGYNPRVDWDVLLQRLERISSTDNVVVQ